MPHKNFLPQSQQASFFTFSPQVFLRERSSGIIDGNTTFTFAFLDV